MVAPTKKHASLIACLIIVAFLIQHRYTHIGTNHDKNLKLTNWDAFGYYSYLPAIIIYKDYKQLQWVDTIEQQYKMLGGGNLYQATQAKNGNYVFKYFGGVALMQLPFFLTAHYLATSFGYPADGFSQPYQYAIGIAALFYAILGIFVLRQLLRKYYDDYIVALTLILLCLASNFPQYAAVDGGQSHIYIFPLYALILYVTDKWHNKPTVIWAFLIGYIIGLATICRPTEALMLFIPLLWNTQNKAAKTKKWQMVRQYKLHVAFVILGGLSGILPQLAYWKATAGTWIFDVGSAWDFLTPHFRVLLGWEKGWLIYTPVTIFFIIGLFYIRKYPFRNAVLWFCILNIYVIIAWRDWQYGGSYSTRALVQSYPVFALSLAGFIQDLKYKKYRWLIYPLGAYLITVNVFQLEQYSKTILHYRDMNRKYYGAIFLNPHPTPADMSLLDNGEILRSESGLNKTDFTHVQNMPLHIDAGQNGIITTKNLPEIKNTNWLKIKANIHTSEGFWQGYINCDIVKGDSIKHSRIRLFNPIATDTASNDYELHVSIPEYFSNANVRLYINRNDGSFDGIINYADISLLH